MWLRKYFILFLILMPSFCLSHDGKHILYINSYSPNFPTYEKVNKVLQEYHKRTNNQIEIQFLYAKKYNSEEYIKMLKPKFEHIMDQTYQLDLILVSDDFGLKFVLSMQDSLFKNIPIVFWGINNRELALEQNNNSFVTGVVEDVSVYETIKHAKELNPNLSEIIAISDDTETGMQDKKNFFAVADSFPGISFKNMDFGLYKLERFLKEISEVKGDKAFLLLSGFVDVENRNYTFDYTLKKIIENVQVPVFHLYEHGLGEGIAGGKLVSHTNQAKAGIRYADSIFAGADVSTLKVIEKSPNRLIYDFKVLKKYELFLANLSEHAELLNTPKEFIFISKNTFYVVSILIALVIIAVFILAYNLQIRKKLEIEVSEAKERYESLFRTSHSVMLLIDPDTGDINDANNAACEYYGYSYEELTSMNIANINILNAEQIAVEMKRAFEEQRNHFEFKHRLSNGEIRDIESYAGKITYRGRTYLYSIVHDITKRKIAEQELLNSKAIISENEQKYRGLFDNTPIGIVYMNLAGKILDINQAMIKMIGAKDKAYSIGLNLLDQEAIKQFKTGKYFEKCVEQKQNVVAEFPYFSRFGKNLFLKAYLSPVFEDDVVVGVQAAIEDISEKNKAEMKIRQSEAQFRLLAENVPGVIYLCENDKDYSMIYLNDEIEKLTGFNKDMFLMGSMKFADLIHPEDAEYVRDAIDNAINYRESFRIEYRVKNSNDEYKWVEENGIGLFENDQLIWLEGFILDITSRKYAEEELTKMAKLESLGVLASGIAHNFKNMLASINLSVDLARRNPNKLEVYAERIEKTVVQANAIAMRFQTFSSGGEPIREVADVCQVLDESLSIALSGTNIQYVQNYKPSVWKVDIDTRQMTEVFTNIFLNSKQAMDAKIGKIYVDVENHESDPTKIIGRAGEYVKISIRDEGPGIKEEILDKIFDPFFTTKEKGHGLGLATVSMIVKKHKGFIKVNSKKEVGTEFKIFLPAAKNGVVEPKKKEAKVITKDKYKILVMDDDEAIRMSIKEMLEFSGHKVVGVAKGELAILEYQKAYLSSQPFDMVILDLTVSGGMEGEETLNKLLVFNPKIRAIVCSAHANKPIMANYRDYGFSGRIDKPLSFDALIQEIERVMKIDV